MATTFPKSPRLIDTHCHRCGGLMVRESLPYEDESGRSGSLGLRCINPLARIRAIEQREGEPMITTTDTHLARRIGEALSHAYEGEFHVRYTDKRAIDWGDVDALTAPGSIRDCVPAESPDTQEICVS